MSLGTLPLLLSSLALASETAHAEGIPWTNIVVHAVNFVLMMGILFYITRTPISDFLKMRAGRIRKELDDATQAQAEARARFEQLEARLNNFEQELNALKAEGLADAEGEARLLAERTEQDIQQIKANAERTIREEVRKAKVALQAQAVELAVNIAEEQIRGQMTPSDSDRLAQAFLGAVSKSKEPAHG